MADTDVLQPKWRKVATNAVRLSLCLLIAGIGIQMAMSVFERGGSEPKVEAVAKSEAELGSWTFAGEGLGVSVRAVDAGKVEDELRGPAVLIAAPVGPKRDGESQVLELLKDHAPAESTPDGRQRWRQALAGIEVFAETCKIGNETRLVVARAAWSAGGEGLSLLEIRPQSDAGSNGKAAEREFPTPDGASEMARRVSHDGKVTGSLQMTKATVEAAADAMKGTLAAKGWSVEAMDAGEGTPAKSLTCRRENERMQVVVFRDEGSAEQTMILCVQE